jgi:hypothetical protein
MEWTEEHIQSLRDLVSSLKLNLRKDAQLECTLGNMERQMPYPWEPLGVSLLPCQ